MRRGFACVLATVLAVTMIAPAAFAGAKLKINDDASLDLGIRLQSLALLYDRDLDGDGAWDTFTDFKERRARFRLKAVIGDHVSAFIQTDVGSTDGGAGLSQRVIDAFVQIKLNQWVQLYNGLNMAPILRQNLTSSGALMAADRPGLAYKSLSWGMRSVEGFANFTLGPTDSGYRTGDGVRDTGITLFGSGEAGDSAHLKYYAAVNDGRPGTSDDSNRYTVRGQLNFFDAEGGYYNSSTYLGKKKTIGIGAGFDTQTGIDVDEDGADVDYTLFTLDGFLEWPVGEGSLTAEAAFIQLDLGDAVLAGGESLLNAQGSGFYGQAGYYFNDAWQPWVEFEQWSSDAANDVGSYNGIRVGLTYYIMGQNANVKVGYETVSSDSPLTVDGSGDPVEDKVSTFLLGTYITY